MTIRLEHIASKKILDVVELDSDINLCLVNSKVILIVTCTMYYKIHYNYYTKTLVI